MRRFSLIGGIAVFSFLAVSASPAQAGCRYFLVSFHADQCKEVAGSDREVMDRSEEMQLPDLEAEKASGKLVRIKCSCEYTLNGSDQRCDFDKTQDVASLVGAPDPSKACAQARSACTQICPHSLDD